MKTKAIFILLVLLCALSRASAETTVVWVSIDGLRFDYVQRTKAPTFTRLENTGYFTNQEEPIFPSLTFPNHIAQVTGARVDHSGIPLNSFYDTSTSKTYSFPDDSSLLRAEPIWVTAKRQGLRVAVIDWPMSDNQTGQWKADYFNAQYDEAQTDQARLDHVISILQNDHQDKPLRLIMSYMAGVDKVGHSAGPDSPRITTAVLQADHTLDGFTQSVDTWFDATHGPADDLYILLTTDHGMESVHQQVNIDRLIGADLFQGLKVVTSGPVATLFLTGVPDAEKSARIDAILAKLKPEPNLTVWKAADVPPSFHYSDPTRIGDMVALLAPGYAFSAARIATTLPVRGGVAGMHGYDPAIAPNMHGTAIVWHKGHPTTGVDIGPVDNTQWHATVAKLLGIQPSPDADPRAIPLP